MHKDARGLAVTAANAEAVRHFDDTIEGYLGFTNDIGDRLKRVFAADPDMPLAHCLKGYFFQLFSNPALDPKTDKALAAATAALNARGGDAREAAHVAALEAWRRGDFETAVARWEGILLDHPLDVLALRLAQHIHFYRGDSWQLRDSVARVLPLWHDTVPGYGYVLGFYAFGLEESGDYAAAETTGRRAVELNPGDIWAVHAVAHVMEMQGRRGHRLDQDHPASLGPLPPLPVPRVVAPLPVPRGTRGIRRGPGSLRPPRARRRQRRLPRHVERRGDAVAA